MNFRWVSGIVLSVTIACTCFVLYLYSSETDRWAPRAIMALEPLKPPRVREMDPANEKQRFRAVATPRPQRRGAKERKVNPVRVPDKRGGDPDVEERRRRPKEPWHAPDVIWLSGGVKTSLSGFRPEKWSVDAWSVVEEELKWKRRAGTNGTEFIPVYRNVTCLRSSGKDPLGAADRHPPGRLVFVEDAPVEDESERSMDEKGGGVSVAMASLPCMLYLNRSIIYSAEKGVFSRIPLSRGLIFGQYKGEYIATGDTSSMARSGYAWALGSSHGVFLYVDAKDERKSNWLRFINCARFEEEQNLYPIFVDGEMYYLVYKDVPAETELLVWYGRSYGSELGMWFLTNSTAPGLSVPRAQMVCPTCRALPTVEEVEEKWTTKSER